MGNTKVTVLCRASQENYTTENGYSADDPTEVGKTVLVKEVNTTIPTEIIKGTDV